MVEGLGRHCVSMVFVALTLLVTGPVEALTPAVHFDGPEEDPVFSNLELALDFGVADRGTTGVGEPLLGYGYDHGGGPIAGVSARLFFDGRYNWLRHGIGLRLSHQANGSLGLADYGFMRSQLDLAYAVRTEFPCMRDGDNRVYLTGLFGLTGAVVDAGVGTAGRDDRWNERVVASEELDHVALGGLMAVGLDLHLGTWLVGFVLDVREQFALTEGPVGRSFETSAVLRAGLDLQL